MWTRYEKKLNDIDLYISIIIHCFQWDYFLRDSRACDLNILFKYERLVSNMKIVKWFYEEYGKTIETLENKL